MCVCVCVCEAFSVGGVGGGEGWGHGCCGLSVLSVVSHDSNLPHMSSLFSVL